MSKVKQKNQNEYLHSVGIYKRGMYTQTATDINQIKDLLIKEISEIVRREGYVLISIQIDKQ